MADDGDEPMEFIVLNKKDALVYQIPPASSSSGHKADDWKKCIWRGRCRIVGKGKDMSIKLLDSSSGQLFAQCQIPGGDHEKYVERVTDSSRYFVLKVTNGDRHAFVGMGFEDRNDAFDFNVALIDFKSTFVDKDVQAAAAPQITGPAKDLSLKEGQKISLNLGGLIKKRPQPAPGSGGGMGIMAPPGGGMGILAPPPPGGQSRRQPTAGGYGAPQQGFGAPMPAPAPAAAAAAPAAAAADDFFADFGGFQSAGASSGGGGFGGDAFGGGGFQSAAPSSNGGGSGGGDAFGGGFANFQAAAPAPVAAQPPAADFAAAFDDFDFGAPAAAPKAAAAAPLVPARAPGPAAPAPAAAAPAADVDPFMAAFGAAAAALPVTTQQPAKVPGQRPGADPFDEFDIFK